MSGGRHNNWEVILDNFARCIRITRDQDTVYDVDEALLTEPEEKALYQAYQSAVESLSRDGNVDDFLTTFEPLVPPYSPSLTKCSLTRTTRPSSTTA